MENSPRVPLTPPILRRFNKSDDDYSSHLSLSTAVSDSEFALEKYPILPPTRYQISIKQPPIGLHNMSSTTASTNMIPGWVMIHYRQTNYSYKDVLKSYSNSPFNNVYLLLSETHVPDKYNFHVIGKNVTDNIVCESNSIQFCFSQDQTIKVWNSELAPVMSSKFGTHQLTTNSHEYMQSRNNSLEALLVTTIIIGILMILFVIFTSICCCLEKNTKIRKLNKKLEFYNYQKPLIVKQYYNTNQQKQKPVLNTQINQQNSEQLQHKRGDVVIHTEPQQNRNSKIENEGSQTVPIQASFGDDVANSAVVNEVLVNDIAGNMATKRVQNQDSFHI
eukprot:364083_1